MAETPSQVFAPTTLAELFSSWSQYPDAIIYAGGTGIIGAQTDRLLDMPQNILSISRIEELSRISRTERYLDIGACVTLDAILALGKVIPELLRSAIGSVANPGVRRLATIGGNTAFPGRRMTCFAALVALDARFELRTMTSSRWASAARFTAHDDGTALGPMELLTRIRLPLENYEGAVFKRLGPPGFPDPRNAAFAFVARSQKDNLVEARTVLAGRDLLFERQIDATLSGKSLPLSKRDAIAFTERWRERLNSLAVQAKDEPIEGDQANPFPSGILADLFLNLTKSAVLGLSE